MSGVVVTVKEGKLRGTKKKSTFSGAEYYTFLGVPYGQSTEGDLRFRDPVKVKPWKGVIDARTEKGGCRQYFMLSLDFTGSEDCLYVNIYTPKLPTKGEPLKPVVTCIHPGGHIWGSPDPSHHGSPDFVIHHDIVYVTICYRLHILGFLNLDVEECSGNQGLKDIILALKWIKENIQVFNGDPENVTFLGSSSGSSLCQFLLLSPATRGLFHKAVLMGHYISNCTIPIREEHIETAFSFAHALGFEGNDRKKLLKFLKNADNTDSFVAQMRFFEGKHDKSLATIFPCGVFIPTIDRGKNAVLPESPRNLIKSMHRIPIIFGICDKEAAIGFSRNLREATERNFMKAWYQNPWGWLYYMNEDQRKFINEQVKSFYFKDYPENKIPLSVKIDLLTDASFSDLYETLLDVIAEELPSSVYVYKFQYEGEVGSLKRRFISMLDEPLAGTVHSDDYGYWAYLFKPTTKKTKEVIETFTKLITTFAKNGDPNYEGSEAQWKPSTLDEPCYLNIDHTLSLIEGKLNGKRFEFWDNLRKQLTNE